VEGVFAKRTRLRAFVDDLHRSLAAVAPASETPAADATEPVPPAAPAPRRSENRHDTEILGDQVRFQKTSWDLVRSASETSGMDQLIRSYWKPLYYFVRQKGYDNETAKDIVQSFLVDALERETIAKADPVRGKFRTFLLTSLSNFIKDWHKASGRLKRGGGRVTLSLDFDSGERQYALEIASGETPEDALDKSWAMSTLESCLSELQGNPAHLRAFRMIADGASYAQVGKETGLSETAAKTAVFRLRQQLRDVLLRRINDAGLTPDDEELAMADFASFLRQS
jgi:RNA polymerase sigma-70 factor (ECF subfamily)